MGNDTERVVWKMVQRGVEMVAENDTEMGSNGRENDTDMDDDIERYCNNGEEESSNFIKFCFTETSRSCNYTSEQKDSVERLFKSQYV